MSKLYVNELQSKTSGGVITNNSQCGFCVGRVDSVQGMSSGSYHKMILKSTHSLAFDTQSGWSDANSYYTVPSGMGGYWFLTGCIQFTRSSTFMMAVITKGADDVTDEDYHLFRGGNGESGDTTNDVIVNVTGIANLSAGDKIGLIGYHIHGSNVDSSFNNTHLRTGLTGWRLM